MKTSIRFLAVIFAVAMMVLSIVTVSANSFSDVTNETPHAKAIDSLTTLGIIHGYEDNTFRPDLPVRRDEMAKLVYTTFTTSTDAGDGVVTFPDVASSSWAKGHISWCAGMKIVGGYEDGTFKPEGNVTYDEALKMVCAMLGYVDFNPEMWPVDVRLKALIDLDLGEGLEDVAGDAVLTRAQVAQLFQNSLDEPMYVAPLTEEEKKKPQFSTTPTVLTLAADVWGYTEVVAEIVATENFGLVVPTKLKEGAEKKTEFVNNVDITTTAATDVDVVTYTKTGEENAIKLRFLDTEGNAIIENGVEKVETVELEDLALEAYVGKTDDLLTRCINVFINKKGEYTSSTLKGKVIEGFSGTYSNPSVPEDEVSYTHKPAKKTGQRYHYYGIKIDGITHQYEDFQAIRKLVYLDKAAREALGYPEGSVLAMPATTSSGRYYLDDKDNVMNMFQYGSWGTTSGGPSSSYKTLSFPRAIINGGTNPNVRKAIDADGDGYYEYLSFNYYYAYFVESVSKKQITLKSAYSTTTFTYDADEFYSDAMPEKGDLIVGYPIADEFHHVGTANVITAFATKYSVSSTASSTTTLYGYTTYSGNTSLALGCSESGKSVLESIIEAPEMKPYVGFNTAIGNYNYANYYIYDGSIVYASLATESDLKNVTGGQNKAILMFVDKPTELQLNEKTKKYETFYPAYLIINGKEELVNLKSTNAINGSEAATIAQDGSMYRAYLKNGYTMYRNMLVSYEVDADGYYSLTTADKVVPEDGEKIIKLADCTNGCYLSIDPALEIMSIVDEDGNPVIIKDDDKNDIELRDNIIANGSSIIYYTYTDDYDVTEGLHEYVGFYLGSEIPKDFNKIELTGDTYLTVDETTGYFALSTTMVAQGFDDVGTTSKKDQYKTDARLHLIALKDSHPLYDETDDKVYANYHFQNIYDGKEVTGMNKKQKYSAATDVFTEGIYAWNGEKTHENYIDVRSPSSSVSCLKSENIERVVSNVSLIFTNNTTAGYKINETTRIIAIKYGPEHPDEEFLFEEITIKDLETLLETIEEYNKEESANKKLTAKIGTYVDDDKKTQVAYIIVDWVEYDEELEAYTFRGIAD